MPNITSDYVTTASFHITYHCPYNSTLYNSVTQNFFLGRTPKIIFHNPTNPCVWKY